jgi:hypothetical protein
MKVVIVGVPRQSEVVIRSIWDNVLTPNRLDESHVKVYLNRVNDFCGGRSGDNGQLDESNYSRFVNTFDTVICQNNDSGLDRSHPDSYSDGYVSLSNLYSYLNLLHLASEVVEDDEAVMVIRPDTKIIDVLSLRSNYVRWGFVVVPAWQDWSGGFNDRFIIGRGNRVRRVMQRRDLIRELFVNKQPLKSELLMKYSLRGSRLFFTSSRVQRLRNDETINVQECFRSNYIRCYIKMLCNIT